MLGTLRGFKFDGETTENKTEKLIANKVSNGTKGCGEGGSWPTKNLTDNLTDNSTKKYKFGHQKQKKPKVEVEMK